MASSEIPELQIDVLVVGGGLAGQVAALQAAKDSNVLLISKFPLTISSSAWAQGGIAAALAPWDSSAKHMQDTLQAGRGLLDPKAVRVLVDEGPKAIDQLIEWGVEFDSAGGKLDLGQEGGHSERRIAHARGGATGEAVMGAVVQKLMANSNIDVLVEHEISRIVIQDNQCVGAVVLDCLTGKKLLVRSNAVVLAMGGASGLYERTTNPASSKGEGLALAYQAGAELQDLEFIQFHPTALDDDHSERTLLISEAVRGEGAHLLNQNLERFMLDVHELAELAPRDVVARAVAGEITRSSKVYLFMRHLDPQKMKQKFYSLYGALCERGFDLATDLVPVAPAAHYSMGGIKADFHGSTCISGLFACGEVASLGIHGANRLASNSMLECVVFGLRAGAAAASANLPICHELSGGEFAFDTGFASESDREILLSLERELRGIMMRDVGLIRSRESLERAINQLELLSERLSLLGSSHESASLELHLLTASLIAQSALKRNETRGAHARSDFPESDERCTVHTILKRESPQLCFNEVALYEMIERALREDLGNGDITSKSILTDEQAMALIHAKETGIISGLEVAKCVFEYVDSELRIELLVADGDGVFIGDQVMKIKGLAVSIMAGERTALNFLQRMSGIATTTAVYVKEISGYNARVLDTRKTAPGLRELDKIAVHAGGGCNHRMGLFDGILIKENHIRAAGGIREAVERARTHNPGLPIEVETTNLLEVETALECAVDIIMLDNMSIDEMSQAVALIDGRAKVEASGGITMNNIREIAATGVDFISIGALTHSVKALDLSLEVQYDADNHA